MKSDKSSQIKLNTMNSNEIKELMKNAFKLSAYH